MNSKNITHHENAPTSNGVNKKIIIAIAVLILIAVAVVVWFIWGQGFVSRLGGEVLPLTRTYDIQQDYCGKALDIRYCNCAFEGEDCEMVGMPNKDTAKRMVEAGFESWVIEKKKEECAEKGGRWINDVCKK